MDRHHLHHRHNHPHPQNNPDPRYIPLRPHHRHQSSLFRPPPLPPPPHGHLRPPPPQQPLPPPPPPQQPPLRPPPPCFVHNPPLSRRHEGNFVDSSHHHQPRRPEGNFVTSLSHHHHHYPQSHRHPPRVVFDDDRNRFRLTDPARVSDLDNHDRCGPVPVRRPINFDRTVEIDDEDRFRSSRFREDLSFENPNSSRFYPVDEVQGRIDDRRVVEIDDQHYRHEQYRPDVLLSEFELNPGTNQCVVRGPRVDEVPIKVSRDEVNARRGVQPRSRDESHLPVKFRNRGIDIDDGFYEKGMNSPGSESGRYVDRGRREEIQDYSRSNTSGSSLRKNLQKKSAFLRIQPLKHTTNSSSRSSRFDTTPSPHKGKGKDKDKESSEYLDYKSSQDRGVSPVELDVSFKSNALVAKAIVGNLSTSPTDYNVNSGASDMNGARIGGSESPLKKESVKKCEKSPSLSRKEEKGSEKKVIRFAMKRVGPSNNADSSKGCVDGGSLKVEGQNSDKGDKLSAPNARKRKKSFVWPSRLSGTVPAKKNAESLDKDKLQNQPSNSCVSEKCIKKSDKEVSSDDQVVGSADKETIEPTVKFDLNECPSGLEDGVAGHFDSDPSCPKKSRKRGSSYEPKDGSENLNGIGEEVQKTSGSDEDFIKSIEKCSSDIGTGCNSSKDQDMVPLLVDCGSGEGSPEPVACLECNLDSIDVDCGEVNMHNSVVVANATSSPLDVSNGAQLRIEETCTHDNHCETNVVLSSEISVVEIPFGGLHLDEGIIQSESSKSEELTNLAKVSNINVDGHKTNTTVSDGLVSVDSEILTTSSDINSTNDTERQECQGAGTTSAVGEAREESSRTIDLLRYSSPFSLEKDVSLPNRKRKVACKLDSLGSGVPASSCDGSVNLPVKDSDSGEKMSSAVSSSPCVIAESNVLHSNELIENPLGSMSSMNHGCDSNPIECYSSCSKKQKIISFEPVSSDALPSKKCDTPAPADTLVSMIEIPMGSVKNSSLSVVIGLPNGIHTNNNVTGEGSDNLLTCKFVDNSKADFLCGESSLPVKEITHLDDKQSSFYSEPSKHQDIMNANMSEFGDGIRSVALESEGRIATDHPNVSVPYLKPELSRDSDNETPVIDMECENNLIPNDVSPSLSDSSQLCAESASDGLTGNSTMMETPGNVSSAGAGCLGAPTVDTSEIVSAVNAFTEMKCSIDDKGSSSMPSSLSNSLVECNEIDLKPGVSASKSEPFVPKTLLVPLKKANNPISSSNVLSRRHVGTNSYTGHASSVMTTSTKAPSTYPTKPRTWRRSDNAPASNTLVKKSSVSSAPPQRPPIDRTLKFRGNSYIRKGNSLVRNPVSNATSLGPHVPKPNETNKIDKIGSSGVIDSTVVHDTPFTMGQNTSIEMPKTPPLPCSDNASNSDILPSEDYPFSPPVGSEGVGNEEALRSSESALHFSINSTAVENRHVEDAGALSDGNLPGTGGKRVVYIKRKSHQLIAATNSPDRSLSNADMTPTLSSDISYYKRRKNQLIRASSESNIHQMVAAIDDSSSSQTQKASRSYMSKSSTKRPSNKVKPAKVSLVWKLGDRNSSVKGADLLGRGKLLSHLLPWKRATNWSVWWSSGNMPKSFSLKTKIVSQKFLSSKKRAIVYMRSGRGFSLRRSKVVSVAGSSLKWSKSMERRSKKVDEEVAKAVAAARKTIGASNDRAESTHHSSHKPGERIFRIGVYRYRMDPSRRTLHRIPDEESADSLASMPAKDVRKTYVPKRLLIGSDEYVRIGNGNQLVRDPKRRTRILAGEKIRWSLHTARTRLAKKRKFCQFFTRFGKCNKGEGKCHFIHDPSKIAVCTKFLNGLCGDPNCKLTHKVIPERMPDCSFFLQGLCSNENCPYRHVNVNPKASICDSFLRGYCAEGNECRKKHSYSCPEYETTGSCPQGSRCKLYHPKKGKSQKRKASKDQRNSRRRYFGSGFTTTTQPETVTDKLPVAPKNDSSDCPGGDLGDFISLYASDDEVEDSRDGNCTAMDMSEGRSSKSQLGDDDDDELITPFRLLNRH